MIASRERLLVALVAGAGPLAMDARNTTALVEAADTLADAACEAWGHEPTVPSIDGVRSKCKRCGQVFKP